MSDRNGLPKTAAQLRQEIAAARAAIVASYLGVWRASRHSLGRHGEDMSGHTADRGEADDDE